MSATYTIASMLQNGATITSAATIRGLDLVGTWTFNDDLTLAQMFRFNPTFSCGAGVTRSIGATTVYNANVVYTPGTGSTFTVAARYSFNSGPTYSNAGTGNTVTENIAYRSAGAVSTNWTVTDWGGLAVLDPTGSGGTVTRLWGVRISDLTRGTTNVSLWSEGANVFLAHAGDVVIGRAQTTLTAPLATLDVHESVAITNGTIGGEVFRLSTNATNDHPHFRAFQGRVTTTDATVTTLLSFTIPATTTVFMEARVVARRTGGASGTAEDGAAYIRKAVVKNVAGTATLIGSAGAGETGNPTNDFDTSDVDSLDCTIDVTGATARVRVTGAATTNYTWHCTLFTQAVGS